jgi:nitrite reductase/ring-hydroxylating ferredoxin subunit
MIAFAEIGIHSRMPAREQAGRSVVAEQSAKAYGGYSIDIPPTETLLTGVGRGTPGGEYLRRFWHPFLIASELKERPVAVRLLGEDLVVFRDKSGRLGLLHRQCLHRGASLEFGIPAEQGIICCYHGWQFDVDGTVLSTPAEPPNSRVKSQFYQGAYHVRELHGLLFAYMGPPDDVPALPEYDTFYHPTANTLTPFCMNLPCNWVQIVENAADPIHNAYLHAIVAGQQFSNAFKVLPQLDFPETPAGMLSMATRVVKDFVFVRSSDIILPNVGQFPSGNNSVDNESVGVRPYITRWAVPVDDTHSLYIGLAHLNSYNGAFITIDPDYYGLDKFPLVGQTGDRPYEERQMEPGDYDAVVSQGQVANRKNEHLGATDRGVVLFRRALARAINSLKDGNPVVRRVPDVSGLVRTFVHEAIVRLPDGFELRDGEAIAEFGRQTALAFINTEHIAPTERDAAAEQKIRDLFRVPAPAAE